MGRVKVRMTGLHKKSRNVAEECYMEAECQNSGEEWLSRAFGEWLAGIGVMDRSM